MQADRQLSRRSIWCRRGRRVATGLNVIVSLLLAAVLLLMVNYLAHKYFLRWDASEHGYYRLSDKTRGMLAAIDPRSQPMVFVVALNMVRISVMSKILTAS